MTMPAVGLAPLPYWYFTDQSGLPLINAKIYTYKSNDLTSFLETYSQPVADPLFLNPNPLRTDGTGTIPYPVYFINTCTGLGASEARRDLLMIFPNVKTFAGDTINIACQAKASTSVTFEFLVYQYFGTGGGAAVITLSSPPTSLTTSYAQYTANINVPNISGATVGAGNFVGIGVRLAVNTISSFSFTNLMIQGGANFSSSYIYPGPIVDYSSSVNTADTFLTGDVKLSYLATNTMLGWLLLDDLTLGNTTSSAAHKGYAYFNLYSFLWSQGTAFVIGVKGVSA